jgi:hypothetical protein
MGSEMLFFFEVTCCKVVFRNHGSFVLHVGTHTGSDWTLNELVFIHHRNLESFFQQVGIHTGSDWAVNELILEGD